MSPRPSGADEEASCTLGKAISTLKMKLAITARTAASKVLSIYKEITVLNLPPKPDPALDTEDITSTQTRIGAMLFSAPTNRLPSMLMPFASGYNRANDVPIAIPMTMRIIRFRLCQKENIFCNAFIVLFDFRKYNNKKPNFLLSLQTHNKNHCMKVQIVNKSAYPTPAYATEKSAGMDLKANITEPITLNPLERALVPTGLYIALPDGTEAQVRPRSGLAAKFGISVLNSPGTIDADYRGEVKVILVNLSNEPFVVNPGERIAQMVVARYEKVEWDEVEVLDETERGEGGFGSTGRK